MIGLRASATLAAGLACFALAAVAQGTMGEPKTPAAATSAQPAPKKNAEPPKKAAPKKAPAKKKAVPKKKVEEKAQVTPQGGSVQKYQAGQAPALRDSKGNVIQTAPDAYDVSSATKPPAKKK